MVVRCRVSRESSLVVKGTLNPPVSALKAGHPMPPTWCPEDAWVFDVYIVCAIKYHFFSSQV